MLICGETQLETVTRNDDCPFKLSEIQRGFFQKKFNTGTTLNEIVLIDKTDSSVVNQETIKTLAFWQNLFGLSTNEKVVVSPKLHKPTTGEAAPNYFGGIGETADAEKTKLSTPPSPFSANLLYAKPQTLKTFRKIGEAGKVGMYLINDKNYLYGVGVYEDIDDGAGNITPNQLTKIKPIPISAFNVGSKVTDGINTAEINAFTCELPVGWDEDLVAIDLSFDHRDL